LAHPLYGASINSAIEAVCWHRLHACNYPIPSLDPSTG